jgi:Lrp/AsnC family leucine-responsive transcriptional regulator
MDDTSYRILHILQEKARVPNVDVARQVGLAPSAVLERIRKLEKQGFIDGYEVRLNPERFDRRLVAFVAVGIGPADEAQAVGRALAEVPDILEVHHVAGEDGYLVKLRVADTAALARLIRRRIAAIPGVRTTRTTVVLETLKETARIPLTAASPQPASAIATRSAGEIDPCP